MLRVHPGGLGRGDAEEVGVEQVDVLDHASRAHAPAPRRGIVGPGVPHHRDAVHAGGQVRPELRHVAGAGEPPGHPDDGDRAGYVRRLYRGRHALLNSLAR